MFEAYAGVEQFCDSRSGDGASQSKSTCDSTSGTHDDIDLEKFERHGAGRLKRYGDSDANGRLV